MEILGIIVAVVVVGLIVLVVTQAKALARRHSRWTVTVHYESKPSIDAAVVDRALAGAFPGAKLASTEQETERWVAPDAQGEFVVRLWESPQKPSPASPTKYRLDLSVIAKAVPTDVEQQALLEKLCRLAVPFARQGGSFVSNALSFPSVKDVPVVKKVEPKLLDALAKGSAEPLAQ